MTNFPWPDCGKEFEEWYEEYCSGKMDIREMEVREIARDAWDAALLLQLPKNPKENV